ncbi:hypothetical protein LJC32_03150 [Oscillospiraceae bacterium OttesenSCG-928-F05]|nr:hypothetical protein [Oscillospiraceae bacterium OttesenSCG-928-F05]
MDSLSTMVDALVQAIKPESILLYGLKKDASGAPQAAKFCIVVETEDKEALLQELYLSLDAEFSFDMMLYTPAEWAELTADPQSYAFRIMEKGTWLHGGA